MTAGGVIRPFADRGAGSFTAVLGANGTGNPPCCEPCWACSPSWRAAWPFSRQPVLVMCRRPVNSIRCIH